jgi:hypothetical protein
MMCVIKPPARKTNDLEGRIVKDGDRKAVREQQTALADLFHAVRQYRTLAERQRSFERQLSCRGLISLVKAIRVRVRSLDSLVARDPDHFFAATAPLQPSIPLWVPPPQPLSQSLG